MTQDNKPTVGRIVHYVSRGSADGVYGRECRAAIVTGTHEHDPQLVSLCVLNPLGMFFDLAVSYGGLGDVGGTWHWPERA